MYHQPVLLTETLKLLDPQKGQVILDCTLGNGGHTLAILKTGATVYGLDADPQNLSLATDRIKKEGLDKNFHPLLGNFKDLKEIIDTKLPRSPDSILADLGLSQNQQVSQDRGFSFNDEKSIDMRLNPDLEDQESAENLINTADFDTLYDIFTKLAQEKYSKPLILRIIRQRQKEPIKSSKRLADIIRDYYQTKGIKSKIDPSTKIFLALKIYINQEFENLRSFLDQSLSLESNTKVAIISFHSGEDRIVKQFIKQNQNKLISLNKKAILPSFAETKQNPLSRSALLRAYQII